jgi:beta-glucosidase
MNRMIAVFTAVLSAGAAFAAEDTAMEQARAVLAKMTLEEKVSILSGSGTMTLNPIPRVGINKEWTMSDNSATVRADMERWGWNYCGKGDESTVLPALSALGSTWNRDLAASHGDVLGAEMRTRGKDMLLGPGVNIMRNPLCGRNWEYMSEDPCLVSSMIVPLIQNIQKHNVSACVKHFCCNNQELNRTGVDTEVDERTLREIYLPAFRAAVQDAGVLTLMNAYNKFRGKHCSENPYLLKDILRGEWGFKGLVVTDWGAAHSTVAMALGGTDVEMDRGDAIHYYNNPKKGTQPLVEAVRKGQVPEATVNEMATHVLYVMAKCGLFDGRDRGAGSRNTPEHQAAARAIGNEAITLLKNDAGVLPLDPAKVKTVLVVGRLASAKHTNGGWSAEGKPLYEITPFKGLQERLGANVKVLRAPLVESEKNDMDVAFADVEAAARKADAVLVFVGTSVGAGRAKECEGGDRPDLKQPDGYDAAVAKILGWKLPNAVVINHSGSPMEMPWVDACATLVQQPYLGQEAGRPLAAVLFGDVNPSGKLPCTWPKVYGDTPVAQMGTYNKNKVTYNEGFYVGYRWYDKKGIAPMFPFGYGLSYTTFAYGTANVSSKSLAPNGEVTVTAEVSNTGKRDGKETVELYVTALNPKVERCVRELRNFTKVDVKAGGKATASMAIRPRDLAYYDVAAKKFRADKGEYEISVGASSRDIRGTARIMLADDWTE